MKKLSIALNAIGIIILFHLILVYFRCCS